MIFEQYPYKTKFKALLVVCLMLGYTAYKRSFSTLISVVKENNELSTRVNKSGNTTNSINVLVSELRAIDNSIGKEGRDKEQIQQDIMTFAATHNRHPSIYNLSPIHTFNDENFKIYTNQLEVTGTVNQLLGLSYDFEKKFDTSRLVGVNFYTVKKSNTPSVLHLKMIFQNYENNN